MHTDRGRNLPNLKMPTRNALFNYLNRYGTDHGDGGEVSVFRAEKDHGPVAIVHVYKLKTRCREAFTNREESD